MPKIAKAIGVILTAFLEWEIGSGSWSKIDRHFLQTSLTVTRKLARISSQELKMSLSGVIEFTASWNKLLVYWIFFLLHKGGR